MKEGIALSLLEADAEYFQEGLEEWTREEFGEDMKDICGRRPQLLNLKKAFSSCCMVFEDQELDPHFDRAKLISILALGLAAFSGLSPKRCRKLTEKVNQKAKEIVRELGEPEFAGGDLRIDQALNLLSKQKSKWEQNQWKTYPR